MRTILALLALVALAACSSDSKPDADGGGGDGIASDQSVTGSDGPTGAGPVHQWSKRFGGLPDDTGHAVAVDQAGNITLAGIFEGTLDLGGGALNSAGSVDLFVASFDAGGAHRWSKAFGGPGLDQVFAVAVDPTSGEIYVTGGFQGSLDLGGGALTSSAADDTDIFLGSFDVGGAHRWSKAFGNPEWTDAGYGVAVDQGAVFVSGTFWKSVDFGGAPLTGQGMSEVFLARFDPSGAHVWSKRFGGTDDDAGYAVAAGAGRVLLTGFFHDSIDFGGGPIQSKGQADIFVAGFTTGGDHSWSAGFGGVGNELGSSVAVDQMGNATVTGLHPGGLDFGGGALGSFGENDLFVASFDPTGAHRWSLGHGSPGPDRGNAVALDPTTGAVFLTGCIGPGGTLDFGGSKLESAGKTDLFLVGFDADGAHGWSRAYGGADADCGEGLAHGGGSLVATGSFSGAVDLGGGQLVGQGATDVFLLKLKQ